MSYMNKPNIEELLLRARNAADEARQALDEIVSSHRSIQSDDDQYDDPELWWAAPALEDVTAAVESLNCSLNSLSNW